MLKYLIVQLDDTSVSYCHYKNTRTEKNLLSLSVLKDAIFWAMKENLNIQMVYPNYILPKEYSSVIDSTDHTDVVAYDCEDSQLRLNAEIVIFDNWNKLVDYQFNYDSAYVIKTSFEAMFENESLLKLLFTRLNRISVVIEDVDKFNSDIQAKYQQFLENLIPDIVKIYKSGRALQLNIITDRMMLTSMNNCNAGWESITLAPNGKFYICPAFYLCEGENPVGNVKDGLLIKNSQLYKLQYSPICRTCDAYQCRRCVWLNKKFTYEVNIPSKEQCVMAHLERNASGKLLAEIRKIGMFLPHKSVPMINYLDPFENLS
jgi:CXXX repeat peptide maturase